MALRFPIALQSLKPCLQGLTIPKSGQFLHQTDDEMLNTLCKSRTGSPIQGKSEHTTIFPRRNSHHTTAYPKTFRPFFPGTKRGLFPVLGNVGNDLYFSGTNRQTQRTLSFRNGGVATDPQTIGIFLGRTSGGKHFDPSIPGGQRTNPNQGQIENFHHSSSSLLQQGDGLLLPRATGKGSNFCQRLVKAFLGLQDVQGGCFIPFHLPKTIQFNALANRPPQYLPLLGRQVGQSQGGGLQLLQIQGIDAM